MNDPREGSQSRQDRIDEAVAEYLESIDAGKKPDREEWVSRYPDLRDELLAFLAGEAALDATHLVSGVSGSDDSVIEDSTAERGGSGEVHERRNRIAENWTRDRKSIGPYRLIRSLGSGGMGQVFEAIDQAGNHVAVKLLLARWMRSTESLQRFRQEGQIASTISHPRCVFVKAADEEDGQPYIVMELMSGKTLKDLLFEKKELSIEEAIRAILDVLEGLEEAHAHGMIHRDIKPANCYLEETGRVKLGDFGLARSLSADSELTQTGDFIGTPLFASPEQVKGLEIDVRSDIYSVCATLYFLLTGRAPFAGTSATTVIARIVSEDPQSLRELNPQIPVLLERIVMRGLNRSRQNRYQTVAELRQVLEPFVSGRQSFATLGRRFAASQLDSLATGLLVGGITAIISPSVQQVPVPFHVYATIMSGLLAYFLIWEGWKNASPGKWLLKLHIVDRQTGEKPGHLRLILRTAIAMLLMGVGSDLLLYLFLGDKPPEVWVLAQWAGYIVSYGVMLSTLMVGPRGHLLLHDFLSGTMVVDRQVLRRHKDLAERRPQFDMPKLAATGYPAQLGEFSMTGLICQGDGTALLSAHDARLERDVWIHLSEHESAVPDTARRRCARTTRLRWLTGGRHENWFWNAFVAIPGAPLKYWTDTETPLNWKITSPLLCQLTDEIDQSRRDSTGIQVQSVDQIWIDARGRLTVLDWSLQDGSICPADPQSKSRSLNSTASVALQQNDSRLLNEVARLALSGKCGPLQSSDGVVPDSTKQQAVEPVRAIVPLHARGLLDRIAVSAVGQGAALESRSLLDELKASATKPTEANFESRMVGLGAALMLCSLLLGIVLSIARLGNLVILQKVEDLLLMPEIAEFLMESSAQEPTQSTLASLNVSTSDLETIKVRSSEAIPRWLAEYQKRFAGLGEFSRLVAISANHVEDPSKARSEATLVWRGTELVAENWPKPKSERKADLRLLSVLAGENSDQSVNAYLHKKQSLVMLVSTSPFLLWILWSGSTRGGISLWISGLAIVDSSGRPAPRWLTLLRALVAIAPMLMVQAIIVWIDFTAIEYLWLSKLLFQVLVGMFVAYAILAIAFPRRAPQDWIIGTHLVPR